MSWQFNNLAGIIRIRFFFAQAILSYTSKQ